MLIYDNKKFSWFLCILCIIVTTVLMLFCASIKEISAVLFVFILFCLPGPFLLRLFTSFSLQDLIILGSAVGMGTSCLFVTLSVFMFGWHIGLTLIFILLLTMVLAGVGLKKGRNSEKLLNLPDWTYQHYAILFSAILVVLLALWLPFVNTGVLTDKGFAYTWLIGHDFLWRVSVAFSVARGLPAECFDYANEMMNYYVLFYSLPAYAYNLLEAKASMESIMLITQILLSIYFVSIFFAVIRSIYKKTLSIFIIMITGFFTYSYIWTFAVFQKLLIFVQNTHPTIFADIMAIKWMPEIVESSSHSHTFYRFFLVQPHVLIALSLFLLCILILIVYSRQSSIKIYLFMGFLTGTICGFEMSIGLISTAIILSFFSIRALLQGHIRIPNLKRAFLFLFGLVIAVTLLTPLGMYNKELRPEGTAKVFSEYSNRNVKNILTAPIYIPMEYGPAAILSFVGLWALLKRRKLQVVVFPITMLFVTLFFFMITSKITGPIKLMRFLPIAFPLVLGYLIDNSVFSFSNQRHRMAILALLTLAIPSYFNDIIIGSNVKNYHNTLYVNTDYMAAVDWLKNNTDPNAVVQGLPEYRTEKTNRLKGFNYEYSLISCFADRKAFLGRIIFATRLFPARKKEIRERFEMIQQIFKSKTIESAADLMKIAGIDYIYVGDAERKKYPVGCRKFESHNNFFKTVYSNDSVVVYECMPTLTSS